MVRLSKLTAFKELQTYINLNRADFFEWLESGKPERSVPSCWDSKMSLSKLNCKRNKNRKTFLMMIRIILSKLMGHVAAAKLFVEKLMSWLSVFYCSWLNKRLVWLSGSSRL